jgi:mRNA interferase MazF
LVDPDSVRDQAKWVPERGEVIWINCNPQAGREMRDRHPLLVLSPCNFNERTSLVIGLPMTTAAYNADNPFAIAVGRTPKSDDQSAVSYVLCHQPRSFNWRVRRAEPHPLVRITNSAFARVCARLNQIIEIA